MSRADDLRVVFAKKINARDEILLDEWVDANGSLNKMIVPVKKFAELFPVEFKDDDNVLGYKDFFAKCKMEKLI